MNPDPSFTRVPKLRICDFTAESVEKAVEQSVQLGSVMYREANDMFDSVGVRTELISDVTDQAIYRVSDNYEF